MGKELMLSTVGKTYQNICLIFPRKQVLTFKMSTSVSLKKKIIINLSAAELVQRMVEMVEQA